MFGDGHAGAALARVVEGLIRVEILRGDLVIAVVEVETKVHNFTSYWKLTDFMEKEGEESKQ